MASLKEVKGRIATVTNTKKITSAMKMVASAKLHKAQAAIGNMLPYEQRLHKLLTNLLSGNTEYTSDLAVNREVKRIALVVFSSNSSLCGAFNSNIIRETCGWLKQNESLGKENVLIYPIGKKIADALVKQGYSIMGDFQELAGKPSFQESAHIAENLMMMYQKGEIDQVDVIYHHFKSTASQILIKQTFLPIDITNEKESLNQKEEVDYILEPSREELMGKLIPKVLRLKLYTLLLDSNASEHAARTMAMQIATDNADDLLQELTLMYNKTRQQAITNELLDIVGGQMT